MKKKCVISCSAECSQQRKRDRDKLYKRKERTEPKTERKPEKMTCPQCGNEFEPHHSSQKFCSDKCRSAHERAKRPKKPLEPKLCAQCGQEFIPKTVNQKYCSEVCCEEYWGRRVVVHTRTCKNCGEKFTDVYAAKYCSKKCRNEAIKKEQAKQAMAKATGEKVKTIADWTREARECNMDYGTYRGLIEQCGRTYEELKATAGSRAAKYHAHASKGSKNACDSGYGRKVG